MRKSPGTQLPWSHWILMKVSVRRPIVHGREPCWRRSLSRFMNVDQRRGQQPWRGSRGTNNSRNARGHLYASRPNREAWHPGVRSLLSLLLLLYATAGGALATTCGLLAAATLRTPWSPRTVWLAVTASLVLTMGVACAPMLVLTSRYLRGRRASLSSCQQSAVPQPRHATNPPSSAA